jgi:hypothetical protein
MRPKAIFATVLLGAAWIAAVSFGLRWLLNYESAPGCVGEVPPRWPVGSKIELAPRGKTLVMLAHPRCPCTRASIAELAQIMAHTNGNVRAYVLFWTPQNAGSDWRDTGLRRSAALIPGVTVLSDADGVEARHFGAKTSGHTLLFGSDGHVLFSGGITESRGHPGESIGESSIISLVNNQPVDSKSTFVFGCSFVEPTPKQENELCPE